MAKYLRSIQAGRYRCEYTYSKISRYDTDRVRAEKKRASSQAQKVVNDRLSRIQLTGILAENFTDYQDSYFVTLTFDELHYPVSPRKTDIRAAMERGAANYLDRLRYQAKKRGSKIFSVWAIGIGEGGRYHIHFVLRGPTAEDIRDCWTAGNVDYHSLYADTAWLSDKKRGWLVQSAGCANPAQIAKYIMQNGNDRPVGKHPWHASRNCKRPKPQPAILVPDSTTVNPVNGAEILDNIEHSTIYGSYSYIEYILPMEAQPPTPGRTREKRKPRE